jgi:hypothetical protein
LTTGFTAGGQGQYNIPSQYDSANTAAVASQSDTDTDHSNHNLHRNHLIPNHSIANQILHMRQPTQSPAPSDNTLTCTTQENPSAGTASSNVNANDDDISQSELEFPLADDPLNDCTRYVADLLHKYPHYNPDILDALPSLSVEYGSPDGYRQEYHKRLIELHAFIQPKRATKKRKVEYSSSVSGWSVFQRVALFGRRFTPQVLT